MPSSLARPESTSAMFNVIVTLHDDRPRRRRYPERTLQSTHHDLRAADHLLGEGRPLGMDEGHTPHYLHQLDRLVETAAEQAPLRRVRGVTHEKPLLYLLQPRPAMGDVPQLEVGQEPPDVVCRVGQAATVEVDQRGPARGGPDVFGFEVPVREGEWLLGEPRVQFLRAI